MKVTQIRDSVTTGVTKPLKYDKTPG